VAPQKSPYVQLWLLCCVFLEKHFLEKIVHCTSNANIVVTTMTTMEIEPTPKRDIESISDESTNVEQPTAFILKLFEMINGAPDEVIAVSDFRGTSISYAVVQFLAMTVPFFKMQSVDCLFIT
jgi:hypothetical protein